MGLPSITIEFFKKASTAIARSERGVVCLIVKDSTKATELATYKYLDDVTKTDYTADNYQAIADAFHDGANKVYVVRVGTSKTFADVKPAIEKLKFDWIAYLDSASQADLVTYVKARNAKNPNVQVKAVVFNATAPNDKHIVNFCNTKILRVGATTEEDGYKFLGRLAGLFAAMPFTRTATYYIFDDLQSVTEVDDSSVAVDAGKLVIINDYGEPKIARAINSLTTPGANETDDMKKITIIEGMDLTKQDIATTFKNSYVGKYKNSYDNQMNFVAQVNHYFDTLAASEILDNSFDNKADIDVVAQRSALIESGKLEAEDWTDIEVRKTSVGSWMYLTGNVKYLDGMEDIKFAINMA